MRQNEIEGDDEFAVKSLLTAVNIKEQCEAVGAPFNTLPACNFHFSKYPQQH